MADVVEQGESILGAPLIETDPTGSDATDSASQPDRPGWQRFLAATWQALRPYGVASWRHPPRGA